MKTKREQVLEAVEIASIGVGSGLFVWLFLLKLIFRLMARLRARAPRRSALSRLPARRMRRRRVRRLLDRVGIHPGERVLEVRAGPSLYAAAAAQRAGAEGRLIVVDMRPRMLSQADPPVPESGLGNVETHIASPYHLPLDDESVDRAFLVAALSKIPEPHRALAELFRVLKPGGVLSITEQFIDPRYPFAFETVRRVESAGFDLERRLGNAWRYTLNFWKNEGVAY